MEPRQVSHAHRLSFALVALVALGFSPCGAEDTSSPTAGELPNPGACQSISELAPALWSAVETDQVAGLRGVLDQLAQPPAEGGTPYLNQILEATFVGLNAFAADPPEPGNTDGLCNVTNPPPLNQTNRLCDLRRVLLIYVHEGQGAQSLQDLGPLITSILQYMLGQAPAATSPHFEIAYNLEQMCTETGNCDPHATMALVEGITAYLTPAVAQKTLSDLQTLIDDPLLLGPGGLLSSLGGGADGGDTDDGPGEAGFEQLLNYVIYLLRADPGEINTLVGDGGLITAFIPPPQEVDLPDGGVFSSDLNGELEAVVVDLSGMLNPNLPQPIYQPLLKTLDCASVPGETISGLEVRPGFVPMIYHLGFVAHVIGLSQILGALQQIITIDKQSSEPGLVMYLLNQIAVAVDANQASLDAITALCNTLFSTERPCDNGQGSDCPPLPLNYVTPSQAPLQNNCAPTMRASYEVTGACQSNVEAGIPEVETLFQQGIVDQLLCTIDTLVYGCTGGDQPACSPAGAPVDAGPGSGFSLPPDGGF